MIKDVALFSNYLNHHQLAICEALIEKTDHHFVFVAFMPTPKFRLNLGYQEMNDVYPFVLKAYEDREKYAKAISIAVSFDLVIIGSAPESFAKIRIERNLLTFRYSERLYKESYLKALSPRGMIYRFNHHTKYIRKQVYLLCASAYTAFDFMLSGAYIGKAYKWGYYPLTMQYDPDELWKQKQQNSILWAGRLIRQKHPELAIAVAEKLKAEGVPFDMNIIGSGNMEKEIALRIKEKGLEDCIHMKGSMTPKEVRNHMEKAMIFLFTSDFNEGWGAVLNESMNSGCAVVASHAIGSVPFLVQDGDSGLIYQNRNANQLYNYTRILLDHPEECERIGKNAYYRIFEIWNADVAAERVLELANSLVNEEKRERFIDGPCSRAKLLSNWWYHNRKAKKQDWKKYFLNGLT